MVISTDLSTGTDRKRGGEKGEEEQARTIWSAYHKQRGREWEEMREGKG